MLDVNMMIANNIQNQLKKENKKQIDLAEGIGVSRQTMSKIMNAFMGRVKTPEARRGIQIADELSDMILFHTKVYENGKRMEQPWEDNE